MRTLLLVVHIGAAGAWFGHKLTVPADIRRSIAAGGDVAVGMFERMKANARLGMSSAVVTVASGVGLLAIAGWRAPVVLGLGIMSALAAMAVGGIAARPAWNGLETAVGAGDLPLAAAFGRRFARAVHVENLLWITALAGMVAA
ncbi:MAG TPA: hypothetical protein VMS74_15370 [Acidimicrobiia bacterium]|nr:hypothetical protein [Acidimicrobiia bacterium]